MYDKILQKRVYNMTINKNGVYVSLTRDGKGVSFQVHSQTEKATKIIKNSNITVNGWSLKINKRPDVQRTEKAFYLRGSDTAENGKMVIKEFATVALAREAEAVLPLLIDKVVGADYEVVNGDRVTKTAAAWAVNNLRSMYRNAQNNGDAYVTAFHRLVTSLRGPDNESEAKKQATTKIRQAVFGSQVADTLKVTGKDTYPTNPSWAGNVNPPKIDNDHLQEHINQAWDVLDKSK